MRGPIHDMREMIDTRGRLLKPEMVNIAVLPLALTTIRNELIQLQHLRNTLLCVSSSALGLESLSAVMKEANSNILNIHLLNGYLRYSVFYFPLKRHLLNNTKPLEKDVILRGPQDTLRDLGVLNTYGGYAFWISKQGNITWRSSGGLTIRELEEFKQQQI